MKVNAGSGFLAEINVTPFVDVMLVLLIIFMVKSPAFSVAPCSIAKISSWQASQASVACQKRRCYNDES